MSNKQIWRVFRIINSAMATMAEVCVAESTEIDLRMVNDG